AIPAAPLAPALMAAASAAPVAAIPTPAQRVPLAPAATAISAERTSAGIGVRLSLSHATLAPEVPLEGSIAVRNLGNEPGVQFRLEVAGLQPDCYDLGPGPILFPGVEKSVFIRLYHPLRPEPHAGRHIIQVRVTAPEAYPGESVLVSQEIDIVPYY